MKRKLSLVLIVIMILSRSMAHGEVCMEEGLKSYLLADFETGQVLESYNINEVIDIASISKLMTYLIVMDNISNGVISLDDEVRIDKDIARVGGSSLKLKEGEVFTVEALLRGAIIVSGNDAAYALSKYVAGSEVEFTKLMNEKAKEIGLTSAVFYNSTGLPIYPAKRVEGDTGLQNRMTIVDIFNLSQHIIRKYPQILEISSSRAIKMVDRDFYGRNTNPLLMKVKEIDGLKTGFTNGAGWCYTSTFNIEKTDKQTKDLRLISIIMGCEEMDIRNEIARLLIDSAIKNYSHRILLDKETSLGVLELAEGEITEVNIFPKEDYSQIVKEGSNIKLSLNTYEDIKLPLLKDKKVGNVEVIENGQVVFKTDAIVRTEVKKAKWQTIFLRKLIKFFKLSHLFI